MKSIRWQKNMVISVETRKGVFVLGQMLDSIYITFFNIFKEDDNWENIDLDKCDILFTVAVIKKGFLTCSNITKQKQIKARTDLYSRENDKRITMQVDGDLSKKTLWKGTPYEIEVYTSKIQVASLLEFDPKLGISGTRVLMEHIDLNDNEIIDKYEISSLENFPLLNERLYLCYFFKRSVCPSKDLHFGRELPFEYYIYMKILMSKAKASDMGYNNSDFEEIPFS